MPTISFRISEEEKKRLQTYGKLSDSLREAVKLYLNSRKSEELIRKLQKLQEDNPIRLTPEEIVRSIKEDRARH